MSEGRGGEGRGREGKGGEGRGGEERWKREGRFWVMDFERVSKEGSRMERWE